MPLTTFTTAKAYCCQCFTEVIDAEHERDKFAASVAHERYRTAAVIVSIMGGYKPIYKQPLIPVDA